MGNQEALYDAWSESFDPACASAPTRRAFPSHESAAPPAPADVVGVHFMNPVHLSRRVEVIRGLHTSERAVDTLLQLLFGPSRRRP